MYMYIYIYYTRILYTYSTVYSYIHMFIHSKYIHTCVLYIYTHRYPGESPEYLHHSRSSPGHPVALIPKISRKGITFFFNPRNKSSIIIIQLYHSKYHPVSLVYITYKRLCSTLYDCFVVLCWNHQRPAECFPRPVVEIPQSVWPEAIVSCRTKGSRCSSESSSHWITQSQLEITGVS